MEFKTLRSIHIIFFIEKTQIIKTGKSKKKKKYNVYIIFIFNIYTGTQRP